MSKANPPRVGADALAAASDDRRADSRSPRKALAKRSKQSLERDALERVVFAAQRPARSQECVMYPPGHRAAHWHHLVPQQHLRVVVRGLRLPAPEARRRLRALLRDERNLVPLCHGCHARVEAGSWPEFDKHVGPEAFAFAAELGPEWSARLRGRYPGSRGTAAEDQEGTT